jgi:hypothetical protein
MNMQHPLIGGGMALGLNDIVLVRNFSGPKPLFEIRHKISH